MTIHQFNRARRWDKKVKPAYSAGVIDGFESCLAGHDCPEPLLSDYNLKVFIRPLMRHTQEITNATIARSRGRYDGWHLAQKEVLHAEEQEYVDTGIAQIEDYLLRRAA